MMFICPGSGRLAIRERTFRALSVIECVDFVGELFGAEGAVQDVGVEVEGILL